MPKATIKLVPWDPESDSHIQRLVEQRKACGWAAEQVPQLWRDAHLAGTKCIWWIVRPRRASSEILELTRV